MYSCRYFIITLVLSVIFELNATETNEENIFKSEQNFLYKISILIWKIR